MDKKAIVLSVAGSDSSGGAGIQADIKAISALGGYAATAITAITVQNTLGVQAVHPVAAELVGQQMQAVMEDLQPDAIKIGMTGNVEIIYEIVRILRRYSPRKVVFDPVMVSTSGHSLMTDEALEAIRTKLIPKVTLVTPNLHETEVLLQQPVQTIDEMEDAACRLFEKYNCAFLIKGGHLTGLEIQEECADMARRSVRYNSLESDIDIICGDIKEAAATFGAASFDVVTSNPPYMIGQHGIQNP